MSQHLKRFILKKEYRGIKPFTVEFKDGVNVLVGENGSGKSSIIHLITGDSDKSLFSLVADKVSFRFFDTEKQNPRTLNPELQPDYGFALASRFGSHGEAMFPVLMASKDFKDTILFVDEPEAGISLTNQMKIFKCFKSIIKNNCQVILTTHSYLFIRSVKEVFSLDSKAWVSSSEYLKSILGE
jgi:predicted ATPase